MDQQDSATQWLQLHSDYLQYQFPIHFAACEGDIDRLKSLIDCTDIYEVNVEDDFFGWTPTHWAAYFGQLPALMCMNHHGVNFDAVSERASESPAHLAAIRGQQKCLKWLLQCGALRNRQDHLGDTPLHKAARIGSLECASLLISHGASLEILNYAGMTPAFLAESSGHEQCAAHIRSFQCIMASRLPSMNAEGANGHGDSACMDCDMEASSLPAPSQAPTLIAPNGFHPFSATPEAQAQMQAAPLNGLHPLPNGFAAQAAPPNGFNPFSNGLAPQAQVNPFSNGLTQQAQVMRPDGLFGSLKRGREEDDESQQKRPCTEARFEANNNTMVMLNSSSLQDLHSSIAATLDYDYQLCVNAGITKPGS